MCLAVQDVVERLDSPDDVHDVTMLSSRVARKSVVFHSHKVLRHKEHEYVKRMSNRT